MTGPSPVRVELSVQGPIPTYLLGKGVDVSLTYERPSPTAPNSPHIPAPTGAFTVHRTGEYTGEELALRTGVPRCALGEEAPDALRPGGGRERYAAADVVRLAVVGRLVRSGVPVARAAALVRAAESRPAAAVRDARDFPNSGAGVQTGAVMTAGNESGTDRSRSGHGSADTRRAPAHSRVLPPGE